jgi:hypothetical protein
VTYLQQVAVVAIDPKLETVGFFRRYYGWNVLTVFLKG